MIEAFGSESTLYSSAAVCRDPAHRGPDWDVLAPDRERPDPQQLRDAAVVARRRRAPVVACRTRRLIRISSWPQSRSLWTTILVDVERDPPGRIERLRGARGDARRV